MPVLPPGLPVQHAEVATQGGSDDWYPYEGEVKFENVMVVDEDQNKVCSLSDDGSNPLIDCLYRYCWVSRKRGLAQATTIRLQVLSMMEKMDQPLLNETCWFVPPSSLIHLLMHCAYSNKLGSRLKRSSSRG
jgi:hypothetical protein